MSQAAITKVLARTNAIFTCSFTGGTLLPIDEEIKGVYDIGMSINATPRFTAADVTKYKATAEREIIVCRILSQWIEPYRWFGIYDKNDMLIMELACNSPKADYVVVLQKDWTILASCEVYLNPTILYLDTEIAKVNESIAKVNERVNDGDYLTAYLLSSAPQIPFVPFVIRGYISYSSGNISPTNNAKTSAYVSIDNIKKIYTSSLISDEAAMVAFYDEEKTYLKDISIPGKNSVRGGDIEITDEIRQQAKYLRISYYASTPEAHEANSVAYVTEWKVNDERCCRQGERCCRQGER